MADERALPSVIASARERLAFNRYRRAVLVVGGLLLLVGLAIGAGMLIEELRRSVEEQRVLHNSRVYGRELVRWIGASYESTHRLAARKDGSWKRFEIDAAGLLRRSQEIAYLDVIDDSGKVVWSTDTRRAGRFWEEGEPAAFLDGLAQRFHGPSGSDDRESIELELVTAVSAGPGSPGALVIGLSEVGIAEKLRQAYWGNLIVLGGLALVLLLGFTAVYRTLVRRRVELTRRSSHEAHLAEMGLLAAGLAHELRNPLNALRFALATLEQRARHIADGRADDGIAELHAEIAAEVADLERIVLAFLDYARPASHEPEECDLAALCESAISIVTPRARQRGVELCLEIPGGTAVTRLPRLGVRQVLVNLLANSVEACAAGQRVTLRASRETGCVRLVVTDEGAGVPQKIRDRLFEPFVTAGSGGTGLGLAICRRIVSEMGGIISYAPRPLAGSTFTVVLPLETPIQMHRVAV